MVALFIGVYVLLGSILFGDGTSMQETSPPPYTAATSGSTSASLGVTPVTTATAATPPSRSEYDVEWLDNSSWISFDTARVEGSVTNNNSWWVAETVQAVLTGQDEAGTTVCIHTVQVKPSILKPGETGFYSADFAMPSACVDGEVEINWTWNEP